MSNVSISRPECGFLSVGSGILKIAIGNIYRKSQFKNVKQKSKDFTMKIVEEANFYFSRGIVGRKPRVNFVLVLTKI